VNFPFFIARRYLYAKKSHNVINVISAISAAGIALASFALICTLSVFNGFHDLISTLFSEFDPELKVVPVEGKFFDSDDERIASVCGLPFISLSSFTLEEQALLQYKSRQQIVQIKGVDDSFYELTNIEGILQGNGIYMLSDEVCDYGIMGVSLMRKMDCGAQPINPLTLFVPKKGGRISAINPGTAFNSAAIYSPGVFFQVDQEKYDDNYILISLDLARRLTGHVNAASSLELKLKEGTGTRKAQRELSGLLGGDFKILDRYEQQADVFKVVKLEKFISYLFLSFILLIACFNIAGSLIMLMIEKQQDALLLSSLGADKKSVERIFVTNGILISIIGAVTGLAAGVIACLLQQHFGFIKLGAAGSFIVDTYPVSVKPADIVVVLITVIAVSFISVKPLGRMTHKFVEKREID
jgi:lipoprotein-releasing system permease protein